MRRVVVFAAALPVLSGLAFGSAPDTLFGPAWPPPTVPTCRPTPTEVAEAKALFQLGKSAHDRADFYRAAEYYRDAYLRDCTAHLLLSNLAKVLVADGRLAEALSVLQLYRARKALSSSEEADLDRFIQTVKARADQLAAASASVQSPAPSSSASAEPSTPRPTEAPSSSVQPPLLRPVEPLPPRRSTVGPWITVGAGGAAIVIGAILAVHGADRATEIAGLRDQVWRDHTCTAPTCPSELNDANARIERAQALQLAGWVTLGVGAAAVIGGLGWYLLGSRQQVDQVGHVRFVPIGTGVGIVGAF